MPKPRLKVKLFLLSRDMKECPTAFCCIECIVVDVWNCKSCRNRIKAPFTVENVVIVSASCKVAWFSQLSYIRWSKSRNLAWGWVSVNIFYRALEIPQRIYYSKHFPNLSHKVIIGFSTLQNVFSMDTFRKTRHLLSPD